MAIEKTYFCTCCRTTMRPKNFFKSNDMEKYGDNDGYLHECKKCISLGIDPWNPETFKEKIFKEVDVPWIPNVWHAVLAKELQKPTQPSNAALIGKYLSRMRINQNKQYRWRDTEFIQERADSLVRETMQRQGFSASEIEKALLEGRTPMPEKPSNYVEPAAQQFAEAPESEGMAPVAYSRPQPIEEDFGLTEEDIMYLRLKWGRSYSQEEWLKLERLYIDMTNSYDIQLAGHEDTLKMVCKSSLVANKLVDIGDIDGFTKASKSYNDLMKAGNFTAAQNKADQGEYIDAVSELVMICEADGFIPRYYVEEPKDKVDRLIQDLQDYTRSLILEETNLGEMLDTALHQIQEDNEKAAKISTLDEDEDEAMLAELEAQLFEPEPEEVLDDEDYEVYYQYRNGVNENDDL